MTELLQKALKKLAELPVDRQETIARMILQEIEQDNPNISQKRPLPKSIGMGTSGRNDLSSRTKELLWQNEAK